MVSRFSANPYTGRQAVVAGWGITSFPMGEPSPVLQKLDVVTLSNFQCSSIIEEPVGLGMICAAPEALQGTCFVRFFLFWYFFCFYLKSILVFCCHPLFATMLLNLFTQPCCVSKILFQCLEFLSSIS